MTQGSLTILQIDDNADNMETVGAILQRSFPGVKVLAALNGEKGLELALSGAPDMILLDIVMPGMDGFEVCRRLKADVRTKDIPVVFVTADQTDRKSRITALEAGGDGFLRKPFEVEELVAQIRTMSKLKAGAAAEGREAERMAALNAALSQVKVLTRLLPICASCKRIRNDKNYWEDVEKYLKEYANLDLTHGCCPDCARKLYPEFVDEKDGKIKEF